jgi:CAAX protease family protein
MEAKKIKLSTVIISILIIAAIEICARLLIKPNLMAPVTALGLARLTEIIFLLIIVKIREKQLSIIGLTTTGVSTGLAKGLIWAFSFGAAAGLVLLIIYLLGSNVAMLFQMQLPTESHKLILYFVIGALIGPIAEEIFFRGLLYGFFRKWGAPAAVIFSTLLFVLPHASGPNIPFTQIIGGILFAVSYEVEKNLLVPITIHSLGNLAIFTLAAVI